MANREIITYGQIKKGVPYMTQKEQFLNSVASKFKEGQRFIWSVRPMFRKRSNPLNSYYWGVIIDCFIRGYEETEGRQMSFEYVNKQTGEILYIPMDEKEKQDFAHRTLKTLFNEGKSTTENTNSQQMEYHEYCREYVKFCYNIYVPLPDEEIKIF